ncbi:SulP family inorganic anion transporter [Bosea sp. (in: a-proteobacteria)]|jgi:SulP family sulfate permease|uniref:SulP family inorganic anion transporter n=1 Tax=Bosea sp. (in: a-proteobacteria) TaxID=1871050 RepID=UPI003F72FA11
MPPSSEAASRPAAGRAGAFGRDLLAGLTLAAITIPEQMATARLGGFEPQVGFYAFVAATLGFALFGASRVLTAGADSTITPIFVSGLAALAASGTIPAGAAALLALLVGVVLLVAGLLRLGWIADLLSVPVLSGFLAGISVHIAVSQLPGLLGIPGGGPHIAGQIAALWHGLGGVNAISATIGIATLATMLLCERFAPRLPGALLVLVAATAAVALFGLEARGVAVLGALPSGLPSLRLPPFDWSDIRGLVPLALIVALVVMMQTATVSRSFRDPDGGEPRIGRDFLGLGAANLLAGLAGSFPVNASPPRTAVVAESGGSSQLVALTAALVVLALAVAGGSLLAQVPAAALAGILLFVAQRIFRLDVMRRIAGQSPTEFALVVLTAIAIIWLPVETGVGIGIGLSLLHGVWMTTRSEPLELLRIPGTTIWWPPEPGHSGEKVAGVLVVSFPAPLLFANAESFRRSIVALLAARRPALLVLDAGGIAAIDYTAAQALLAVVEACRERDSAFAIARVESVRAFEALERFGVTAEIGASHVFHSVEQAVMALAPRAEKEAS